MRKWTRQPPPGTPIDWNNPLTRNLHAVFIPVGDSFIEVIRGLEPTEIGGTPSATMLPAGTGPYGRSPPGLYAVDFATQANGHYINFDFDLQFTEGEDIAIASIYGGTATQATLAGQILTVLDKSLGSAWVALECEANTNDMNATHYQGSFWRAFGSEPVLAGGTDKSYAFVSANFATDTIEIYVDGILRGSQGSVGRSGESGYDRVSFGMARDVSPSNALSGSVGLTLIYKGRNLNALEWQALAANPYQIFKPKAQHFALADPLPQTRSLTVPQVWTSPPPIGAEIDWTHPLAHKLVMLARPVNETLVIDDVYGDIWNMNQAGIDVDEGRFLYSHPLYGRARGLTAPTSSTLGAGARDGSFDTRNRFTSTDLSIATVYQMHNDAVGGNSYFGMQDPGGGDCIIIGHAPFNVSSQFQTAFSGGSHSPALTDDNAVAGQLMAVGATFFTQGATSTNRMWLHNMTTGAKSTADSTGLNNLNPAALNSDVDRFGFAGVNNVALFVGAIWDRQITLEEMDQFTSNPWQIYKRDPMHVPIEYEELTFDEEREERLFMFPRQKGRDTQP